MALTDHSPRLTVANGLSRERLTEQLARVEAINASLGDAFTLLKGIEVDIHLDALEQREGVAEARVDRLHPRQLVGEALTGEAVGDGEARGVVGQGHPLLAELDRREDHLLDGASAVAPVGVGVQVTAEGGIQLARRRWSAGRRASPRRRRGRPA